MSLTHHVRWRPGVLTGLFVVLAASGAGAQAPTQVLPPTNQDVFAPLPLPTPTTVRTGAGEPGPDYWQQRADYEIRVTLEPETHRIKGSEVIVYTNNSPDALDELWIQLEQNLFRPGSRGSLVNSGTRWRGAFEGGGIELTRVEVVQNGRTTRPAYLVDDTRMRIDLPEPVAPKGGTIDIRIDWEFTIPEYGADRMGRFKGEDGWVYELAQWYPRMYVYDDVEGWNPMPYIGQGEFYLEYGDFDVEITVPRDFVVVATGELQNPEQVLTAEQRKRLERARKSDETIHIISPDEVGKPESRPRGKGPLTWRFRAENVRDFAWAASPAFIWDAAGWDGILLMSAYPREGLGTAERPGWEMSTQYVRHSIQHYSETWSRYPYPVAINVAGVVGGMEYPMIVFCSVHARDQALFGVTDHEFGHTWFPMIVGNDERRWAWMDEGLNTLLNHYSNLAYYGEGALRNRATSPDYIVDRMLDPTHDQPTMTYADQIRREGLGFLAYRKPGFALILLREVVLGRERFDAALKEYIDRWAYKHPQPADFFRTIEEVSGEDLDWFWRGWFYTNDLLDQAVDSVTTQDGTTLVHLSNREGLVMPVTLEIEFADRSTERHELPVEIWFRADTYAYALPAGREIVRVTIDPDGKLPDVRRENDVWQRTPAAENAAGKAALPRRSPGRP
jgi:hypothetical protein